MPKCCAYGIPNDPQGAVIRFTLCADDNQPCPQFTQWLNLGSWPVASCSDCKVPDIQPRLKCCSYGIPNDPEGQVVRFTLCTPESEPCPQFAAYTSLGSWVVANCEDCKPPPTPITPSPDRVREFAMFLDEIARSPLVLEKLRDLGLIPKLPPKPKPKRR